MKRKGILIVLCVMIALFACGFVACKKKHTHSYVATVVEPTCSTQGYTEHVCSCGESYKDSFVEPSGHSEGEPVYIAGSVSSDQKSAVISEITSCKFCSVQLNKKDYNVSLPEATFSYDGKVHESKISGDKLPDDIMVIYSYVGLSAHSFADGVISAGDYDVAATFYKKSMPIEPLLSLISDLHIIKDGKYHEVTFCFDDLLTNNISIAVKHGESIAKDQMPEIPDKNGYSGEWVYSDEKITADISISVFYTPIEYKITYVLDGAANNPRNPKTYTYESGTLTLYAPESSAGYTFQGWYTSPEFESQSRISLIKSGSTGDLVLYAKFLKYRVEAADGFTFDYENYDYPALIQTVSSTRSSITLSTTIKVSDGCTWTLSRDIEGLNVIKTKNMSLVEGHNTAYVTVWYGEEYNVVYYLDVYRLGLRSYTFYVDDKVYRSTATVEEQSFISAPEAPEKTGYTFNGWYAYEIPEEESDAPVIGSTVTAFPYRLDHNVAFYALFTPNVYTASFDVNGGKPLDKETQNVTYDTLFVTAAAKRDGYTFVGWTDEFGVFVSSIVWKYARSMTFTAQWKLNVYTFTYVYNDGTGFEEAKEFTIEDDDFVLDIPTRTAYNFEGWYTEPELENLITVLPAHSFGDKTFYAKWSPVVYKIDYELNGGNNNAENPESYTVESETITLADPSRTGYAFDGWYTEETFENKTTGIESGLYGNETFYAKWTAVVYKINYELNGGSNGENSANYTIESETITLADPSRTGYDFDGWYTEETFENKTTDIESGSYGNKTFYAKWTAVVYKINYELNGGSNNSKNPASYTIASGKITLAEPSGTHPFTGWYKDIGLNQKITEIAAGSYGDITLYAGWQHGDSDEWIVDKEPTCMNTGLRHRFCSICGSDYYESIPIDPKVHVKTKEVEENVVESTCRKAGSYDVVVYCTECNLELSRQTRAFPLVYHALDENNICAFCGLSATKGLAFTKIGSSYEVSGIGTCTGTDIIVPKYYLNEQVISIGGGAFSGCSSLTSVVIPDSVTSIGLYAFSGCSSLTNVVIPDSVTSLEWGVFENCSSLTSIVIPGNVVSIEYAFSNCSSLTSVLSIGKR